jgi:hypothetical protein
MKNKLSIENFTPVFEVGVLKIGEDQYCPATIPLSSSSAVLLSPESVSGLMTSFFDCIVDMIEESQQIDFEKDTINKFIERCKERELHVEKVNLKNDNQDEDEHEHERE